MGCIRIEASIPPCRSALHEISPPDPLDIALELDPQRAVVPARTDTAVDLARLEDEPAALAERDEGVHRDHGGQDSTAARASPSPATSPGGSGRSRSRWRRLRNYRERAPRLGENARTADTAMRRATNPPATRPLAPVPPVSRSDSSRRARERVRCPGDPREGIAAAPGRQPHRRPARGAVAGRVGNGAAHAATQRRVGAMDEQSPPAAEHTGPVRGGGSLRAASAPPGGRRGRGGIAVGGEARDHLHRHAPGRGAPDARTFTRGARCRVVTRDQLASAASKKTIRRA